MDPRHNVISTVSGDIFDELKDPGKDYHQYLNLLKDRIPDCAFQLAPIDNIDSSLGDELIPDYDSCQKIFEISMAPQSMVHSGYLNGEPIFAIVPSPLNAILIYRPSNTELAHLIGEMARLTLDLMLSQNDLTNIQEQVKIQKLQAERQLGVLESKYQEIQEDNHQQYQIIEKQQVEYSEKLKSEIERQTAQLRLANRKLKMNNLLQQKILDNAVTAIFTVDHHQRITNINEEFQLITGYRKEDIIGKHCRILKCSCCRGTCNLFKTERVEQIHKKQCTIYTKEGKQLNIIKNTDILPSQEDGDIRISGVESFVDVTDLIKMREEAESANRAKSEFLATMSHEIRTPLNAIIGMTHLLEYTHLTEKQKGYLKTVTSASKGLLNIITDILDFSKIEARKLEIESIIFNLDDVLNNLSNILSLKAGKKGIELIISTDPSVPIHLIGDPNRLGQVLLNLADNAIKFTESGEVTILTELINAEDDIVHLKFSVIDSGIGLTETQLSKLFHPFTQADGSTTRKYGGTGLGLSISKQLVELMGGNIGAESISGTGSSFYFTLSLKRQSTDRRKYHLPTAVLKGLRVLAVESHDTSQAALQSVLESFSFKVTSINSGKDTIDELELSANEKASGYELIIMAQELQDMSGFSLAEQIKNDNRFSKIPMIMLLPALVGKKEIQRVSELGIEGYVIKAVNRRDLFDAIINCIYKDERAENKTERMASCISKRSHRLKKPKVLLVEDNQINQLIAVKLLEHEGNEIIVAKNGREAIEKLKENTDDVDLVLMDIQMPVMDGYEATRMIRMDRRFKELPIIAMTAHAMAEDIDKCHKAGMNDHLAKPIDPEEMKSTLLKWMPSVNSW